jgi:origin recognition complex subunit 1
MPLFPISVQLKSMPSPVRDGYAKVKSRSGVSREDSDDELGTEDHPWEWIYDDGDANCEKENGRKRKRSTLLEPKIVGARMGDFQCRIGDTVLLKAELSNEAWVGIITDFGNDDEEGEMAATFMWFSNEKEIRNKDRKRTDFLPVSALAV